MVTYLNGDINIQFKYESFLSREWEGKPICSDLKGKI